jgi:transposase
MRKVREILRLRLVQGLSVRETARATASSTGVVSKVCSRVERLELTWGAVEAMDDDALDRRLYGGPKGVQGPERPRPDPRWVALELRKRGVTLELLHLEFLREHPDGVRYSAFCAGFRRWQKRARLSMRQVHKAGERAFVDYSGKRPSWVCPRTGEVHEVELFVGVLGASNLTFALATETQQIADFVGAHVEMFEYFGGVPAMTVPDQLRSAVKTPCRHEPTINATYAELGRHYGTAIVPARPRKPKDKAKVEVAVQVAQRWILAALRHEVHHSLSALNVRIRELCDALNRRPMKHYDGRSRRDLFVMLDQPALAALPATRYAVSTWTLAKVAPDYHVVFDHHYYSVPYTLRGEQVEVRTTAHTVEVYFRGRRVAAHRRRHDKYRHSTDPAHLPEAHAAYFRGGETVRAWSKDIGPWTTEMVELIFRAQPFEIQGWRSAQGLRRLEQKYGAARLEAACEIAVGLGARRYKPVERILRLNRDQQPNEPEREVVVDHDNVRGADYYH